MHFFQKMVHAVSRILNKKPSVVRHTKICAILYEYVLFKVKVTRVFALTSQLRHFTSTATKRLWKWSSEVVTLQQNLSCFSLEFAFQDHQCKKKIVGYATLLHKVNGNCSDHYGTNPSKIISKIFPERFLGSITFWPIRKHFRTFRTQCGYFTAHSALSAAENVWQKLGVSKFYWHKNNFLYWSKK